MPVGSVSVIMRVPLSAILVGTIVVVAGAVVSAGGPHIGIANQFLIRRNDQISGQALPIQQREECGIHRVQGQVQQLVVTEIKILSKQQHLVGHRRAGDGPVIRVHGAGETEFIQKGQRVILHRVDQACLAVRRRAEFQGNSAVANSSSHRAQFNPVEGRAEIFVNASTVSDARRTQG